MPLPNPLQNLIFAGNLSSPRCVCGLAHGTQPSFVARLTPVRHADVVRGAMRCTMRCIIRAATTTFCKSRRDAIFITAGKRSAACGQQPNARLAHGAQTSFVAQATPVRHADATRGSHATSRVQHVCSSTCSENFCAISVAGVDNVGAMWLGIVVAQPAEKSCRDNTWRGSKVSSLRDFESIKLMARILVQLP
jgi:hypothetical protein